MEKIVANGPWNIEDHMLLLDEVIAFAMVDFWAQIISSL